MHSRLIAEGTRSAAAELSNDAGISVRVLALGAAIQSLSVPDRHGLSDDIVLGYDAAGDYASGSEYFGATVGRFANRIARGKFTLDGTQYTLETNDGPNHLHGGLQGLDKVLWRIDEIASGPPARVVLSHVSPAGAGGYPGTLSLTATYSLSAQHEIAIEYCAKSDRATIVSITNHAYFNLAGASGTSDVLEHRLTIFAQSFTPVDPTLIPTGELRSVSNTPFDFRQPHSIGQHIRESDEQLRIAGGYDHNFAVDGRPGQLRPAARLEDPGSGRVLEVLTTAPGLQFYSGNLLDGTVRGKAGRLYRRHDGLCLEPQAFPDAPNHPEFPSTRLDPAQEYARSIVLRFSTSS